ncbi:MAG: YggS family pyridoxal phosphate-dependent enzyme [Sorangiineae bacterium]|nr:YggS family pyridoxal phosphate-dependent enzyme [Polyangiaceae bacterium]MEB2321776.1 YggS family pyridoxal phosphate-dependent enzyme [Sorangiineae bacterium]
MSTVAEGLSRVRERIARAADVAGRDPASVRLLAVSKTKPASALREAYAAGQRDFGENYVQELLAKAEALADLPELSWHMIGHLQTNKARQVVRVARAVHTVDSTRLARELGKRAAGAGVLLTVLAEVNLGGEAQKSGCAPRELEDVLAASDAEPALALAGLMTVPPHTEDPAGARPYFDELRALRDAHGGAARLPELSMGMTHDLEHAILAGATIVRVGTAIFGARGP